jgi:hypothetical protein
LSAMRPLTLSGSKEFEIKENRETREMETKEV